MALEIYLATNTINGKQYVGQTRLGLESRKRYHIYAARSALTRHKSVFGKALKKYGPESFTWRVIRTEADQAGLDAAEAHEIRVRNTSVPGGYNVHIGGRGGVLSETQREEARERSWGRKYSYLGQTYSIFQLRDKFRPDLSVPALWGRLNRAGMTVEEALSQPLRFNNLGYRQRLYRLGDRDLTIGQLLDLSVVDEVTLSTRLKSGWSTSDAVSLPKGSRPGRTIGKKYSLGKSELSLKQLHELCSNGISLNGLYVRLQRGMTAEEAISLPVGLPKPKREDFSKNYTFTRPQGR